MRLTHRISSSLVLVLALAGSGMAKEKKPAAPSAPTPTYSVGLLPFQDMSGGEYGGQLKDVLAKQLQAAMLNGSSLTPRMMKLGGDNPDQTEVDIPYAVKLGKYYKSDLAVMGSVLQADVEEKDSGFSGPSFGGVSVSSQSRSQDATVVLQADIVDVGRGQKLASLRVTGKDHEGKISPNLSTSYGSMDMGSADFSKTALGKATQRALTDLVARLVETAGKFSPAGGAPSSESSSSSAPSASGEAQPAGQTGGASSSCHVLLRVLLNSSMTPLKDYTVAVAGEDHSNEVKDGVLQINNPAAQFVLQVTVKNPPEDAQVQPVYAGTVDCKCDKPEKVLVLEIDSKGNGKFNWWQ